MGKIKFRVSERFLTISPKVSAHEVISETEHTVTFKDDNPHSRKSEKRENLSSEFVKWFDSFESAKKYAVKIVSDRLEDAKRKVIENKTSLERLENLQQPEVKKEN